jgi:dipeptidyl aminopeptidase/acylaminoacyl peptidase
MKQTRFLLASMLLLPLCAVAAPDALRTHGSLALAPAGDRTIDVEALDPGNLPERPHGSVVLRDARGKVLGQFDPCATCRYSDTAWSPHGDTFAFVGSDTKSGKTFIYRVAHGAVETLSEIEGAANTLRFAPDGSRLALLLTPGAHKKIGAVEAGAPQTGEIGESADEQRIATLALAPDASAAPVSPDNLYVYEYDWTPDGKGFVATAAEGNGDNNWWVARLVHVDAANGALRTIAKPALQMNLPRVSPDGRSVAFVGGLMSDWGAIGGDVFTVPIGGGEPVDVTPEFKGSFNGLAWDGAKLLGVALADDHAAIVEIDPAKRGTRTRWSAPVSAEAQRFDGSIAFNSDRRATAAVIEDFTHAPEIARGTPDALAPVTRDNAAFGADVSAQSIHWNNEGLRVQGWLVGPPHATGAARHPLIVVVHGGPSSAMQPRYISANGQTGLVHDLVERGYYVLYPNPRGSYGQGEAFTRANMRDFGGGDLRDILAGIDAAAKAAPIDPDRVGAFGHSYGGWMTMWMNTQTHRFKALVSGAGVANWLSYYGQNGIDQWMLPFFGASVYDDPAVYRKSSPIEFIKQAKTPTLIYVGERDVECPEPQSQEYWHALHTLGVPTQFVVYPGEGHAFRDPKHTQDLRKRVVDWYERWLK